MNKKTRFSAEVSFKSKKKIWPEKIKDYYFAVTLVQKLMKSDVKLNILVHFNFDARLWRNLFLNDCEITTKNFFRVSLVLYQIFRLTFLRTLPP
jgi:hypothetical protein